MNELTIDMQQLCEDLFLEDVNFMIEFNERKNLKGILISRCRITIDENDDSFIITGGDNIEFIYPYSDIIEFEYNEFDNCFCLTMIGNVKILLSTTSN